MSSKGTTQTSTSNFLTAKEICDIIAEAGRSHVKLLNLPGLSLAFHDSTKAIVDQSLKNTSIQPMTLEPPPQSQATDSNSQSYATTPEEEDELLSITDPVAYEKKQLEDNLNG